MRAVLSLLPLLGCGAIMVVCARVMFGGHRTNNEQESEAIASLREETAQLRSEVGAEQDRRLWSQERDLP